ncbi:hypothetical protein LNP74_19200 [Klebsiella pneumoniae subsp. pneumoniae]|nr:hypothetical protein [Klebsiella pneumoniae subsp. pneumoniae]
MPNMEAARISYNLLRVSSSEGVTVGPVLMGGGEAGAYPDADRLPYVGSLIWWRWRLLEAQTEPL